MNKKFIHLRNQSKSKYMETTIKRKSVVLTEDEFAKLKTFFATFNTAVECAEAIGIHRNVLDRVMLAGSGSVETIGKVRAAIRKSRVK